MQHPEESKRMWPDGRKSRSAATAVALCLIWLGTWVGFGTGRALADDAPPPANVARLSFVQGSVQIFSGNSTDFDQAVMNMPLVEGSRVQTGADGQAEIEFNDGSVARLTPSSSLQLEHVGEDKVQMRALSGLSYFELNVGQGHPPYAVEFSDGEVEPSANSIFRLDLDNGAEVAVISGALRLDGDGIPSADVTENQSVHFDSNTDSPYAVVQGVNEQSWDRWNQDRDREIAQEASQQTPVRDDSGSVNDENWNDLDAYGDWYPMEGYGNVWVPAGTDAGWDPFGSGYWGYYSGFGYTWISGYPWGWLPYHCGSWNYFSFGWGWSPGGCGGRWLPVVNIGLYPHGYFLPPRPVWHGPHGRALPDQRLVLVDRGPAAKGPWAAGHPVPLANHERALQVDGRELQPIGRTGYQSSAFMGARGTSPGVRAVLSRSPGLGNPRGVEGGFNTPGSLGNNPVRTPAYVPRQTYTPRPPAEQRSSPTPHYSAPPPRYSPPPQHYSPPPAPRGSSSPHR